MRLPVPPPRHVVQCEADLPYGLEFSFEEGNIRAENRNNYNGKFVIFPDEKPENTVLKFCPHRGCSTQVSKSYHNPQKIDRIKFKLARYDSPEQATYPANVRVFVKFSFETVGWPANNRVQAFTQ